MNQILKVTAAVSAAAMLLSMTALFPAHAADVCKIDTSSTHQTIRGFGGINLPEWITQGDMTDAQRQKAFGNGADELGLTILRIYCSDDSNAWKNAVPTAKYAQKMGATIFATPWNPPASMRFNGDGTITGGKYQLDKSKSADYAKHLNNYIKYMESQGINLYSISVQNEPDYAAEWTYWSPDELSSFIANYGKAVTAGTNAKLMSPESFQYRKDIYNAILANPQASANVDLYGTHFYGTPREWMDFPALENSGKEIWMTEVYVPDSHADSADLWPDAIKVSENIHNGVVVGNLNAYVWWYIRRSYGLLKENGEISKRGYCMAQYSKFVRPGDVRIDATESPEKDVYISAFKNNKGQVTVVAVNESDNGYAQQFSLSKGETITDVDRWRTSANENIALTENLEYTGSSFWAQLPAKSVSTFVISTDASGQQEIPTETQPATEVQPDADGYYIHDTFEGDVFSWTGRGAATVTLSGRTAYEGKEALLVQERTSAWHGAAKVLDASIFKPGNAYSFSTNAMYFDGKNTDTFYLKLQYKGSDGETHYASIAEAQTVKGQWVQLANKSWQIPADASDMLLYVETPESTNNFYIDEVIVAKDGTEIKGAEAPVIEPTEETQAPTEAPVPTETQPDVSSVRYGDVNLDGNVNILDVITLNRAVLGKDFLSDEQAANADVDLSGKPDSTDSLNILKYIVGLTKSLPVGNNLPQPTEQATEAVQTTVSLTPAEYMQKASANIVNALPAGADTVQNGVDYGTMTSETYYSTTRERQTPVKVLLPPGYNPSETYPVLYMMHGYWETQDTLSADSMGLQTILGNQIASGDAKKMIVVFPYIYTSKTQEACSGMNLENSLNYDNFINDLKTDLMPWVEQHYSVKKGRENTAISGFSMGGRESQFIGISMSDTFGYVGAVCPAPGLTPGADLSQHPGQLQESELKFSNPPYLFLLSAAVNDPVVGTQPESYHNIYTANGTNHIWNQIPGGGHDGNSIRPHFYNLVRNLFC